MTIMPSAGMTSAPGASIAARAPPRRSPRRGRGRRRARGSRSPGSIESTAPPRIRYSPRAGASISLIASLVAQTPISAWSDAASSRSVAGRARPGDRARFSQHVHAVGDREREVDVLLRDEDRLALVAQAPDAVDEQVAHLRREPLRRLVHEQQARVRHQRAADREHLLLAARQGRGGLARPLGEPREQLEDALDAPAAVGRPRRDAAGSRRPRGSGRRAGPAARARGRGARPRGCACPPRSWPSKRIEPLVTCGGRSPLIARSRVVLPMPLRPRSATTWRASTLQRRALEDARGRVAGVEVADVEHRSGPTEVDGLDALVAAHLVGRAERDRQPVVEAEHPVGEPEGEGHVVLDEQEGQRARQRRRAGRGGGRARPPAARRPARRGAAAAARSRAPSRSPAGAARRGTAPTRAGRRARRGRRARAARAARSSMLVAGPHPSPTRASATGREPGRRGGRSRRRDSPPKRLETWNVRARPRHERPATDDARDVLAEQLDAARRSGAARPR